MDIRHRRMQEEVWQGAFLLEAVLTDQECIADLLAKLGVKRVRGLVTALPGMAADEAATEFE